MIQKEKRKLAPMNFVVTGESGVGKSTRAKEIADFFGCDQIIDVLGDITEPLYGKRKLILAVQAMIPRNVPEENTIFLDFHEVIALLDRVA